MLVQRRRRWANIKSALGQRARVCWVGKQELFFSQLTTIVVYRVIDNLISFSHVFPQIFT